MARPQAYDHHQVLDNAMQVFWRKGYATTSIKDLTDATSLQPGSLYGAFKNKRNLFLESLDYYFLNLHLSIKSLLHSEEVPLKRIRLFFDNLLNIAENDTEHKSCLLLNTLLEVPMDDVEINQRVTVMFSKIEEEFCNVLIEAQKEGSLAAGSRPEALAKMLMSGIFGIQAYNRMKPDKASLRQISNNLLSILDK